jgi:hypothetical protein
MANRCFIPFSHWHHMKGIAGPSCLIVLGIEDSGELQYSHFGPLNYHFWCHRFNANHRTNSQRPSGWHSARKCCMDGSNSCCLHISHGFIHLGLASLHLRNHTLKFLQSVIGVLRTSARGPLKRKMFYWRIILLLSNTYYY